MRDLKQELSTLRVQKVSSGAANKVSRIQSVRKSIARVLTVIKQNQRDQLKLLYANKKYKPLDLRHKKTRAIRKAISKKDASRMTERQKKRKIHFSLRKFAVKAY